MKCDVCIIGSGAGAAPVAYELSRAGFDVIVLEKGPNLSEEDFSKDEIAISRRSIYTPKLWEEQHVIETYAADGTIRRTTGAESEWSFWNGSMVGGSSNLMSGFFHRMKPMDFKLLSTFGAVEGANIVDWPITYDEMEPWYDYVEKVVGVSGRITPHRFAEPRSSKDFPFAPTWEQPLSQWIDTACKGLGYESIPTPRAILPHNALHRHGCSYSNFCGSYGCATGAKSHAKAALLNQAVSTGKCHIIADAFVYRLKHDALHVTQAHYYDNAAKSHAISAHIFVVAAQAIETSRLLLNSKSQFFPNGLANNSNNLGKNLIFSGGGAGQGRLETSKLLASQRKELFVRGAFVNRSLQQWYAFESEGKRYKGGTIDFLYQHANPIPRAMGAIYDDQGNLQWGAALDRALKHAFLESRIVTFEVFNDWLPTDKNFVSVDEDVKDKLGVPVGALRLYGHDHDLFVGNYLAQKGEAVLKALGCEEVESTISSAPPPNLVAGGCRFGNDPKTSVLNKNCRAHELENLYVSDASFMPTGGSVPYTWSIYANAFRVAKAIMLHLQKDFSR
jgi:choline dehydrogenase-like flavoprotein